MNASSTTMPATPRKAILSLGSNLGNRGDWLAKAVAVIAALPETQITARSSIYETEPVDVDPEHKEKRFLNAVLLIETALSPQRLSDAIHQIEADLQRVRTLPNQPRNIDIDMIAFDDLISDDKSLILPHPRAHLRRFVLQPLAELEPLLILPGHTATVSTMLKSLPEKPVVKLYSNWQ